MKTKYFVTSDGAPDLQSQIDKFLQENSNITIISVNIWNSVFEKNIVVQHYCLIIYK